MTVDRFILFFWGGDTLRLHPCGKDGSPFSKIRNVYKRFVLVHHMYFTYTFKQSLYMVFFQRSVRRCASVSSHAACRGGLTVVDRS